MEETYQERFERVEVERKEALMNRDSKRYFMLCNENGVEPEVPGLYSHGRKLAFISHMKKPSEIRKRGIKNLVRMVFEGRIDSGKILENSNLKRESLLNMGYTHLNGPGGQRIPIDYCSDARVGEVFLKQYEKAVSE